MKLARIISMAVFFISFLATTSLAIDETCIVSSPSQPGSNQGGGTYNVTVNNPIRVSSIDVGYQNTGCAAATLTSMSERSNLLGTNGQPEIRDNLINTCVRNGGVTSTTAGSLDQHITGLISMLQNDPKNCYRLTLKSMEGSAHLPPIKILPPPQKTVIGNVEKVVYKPYSPQVSDITDAMLKVSNGKGGVGMSAVSYENGIPKDHHMFQPIALNTVARPGNLTERRHDFKAYDPLHARDMEVSIAFDNEGRLYTNLWERRGAQIWFNIQNLIYLENLGPCLIRNSTHAVNLSKGFGSEVKGPGFAYSPDIPEQFSTPAPVRGPHTPMPCGPKIANMCQRANQCPQDEYCNAVLNCMCKEKICGDRVVDPGEECDGGRDSSQNPSQCPHYPNICMGCKCLVLPEPPEAIFD